MRPDFVCDGVQHVVQQLVTGIGEINVADVGVGQSNPSAQREIQEQCAAQSQTQMSVIDHRSAGDAVVGEQEEFFGQGGHGSVVGPPFRCQ